MRAQERYTLEGPGGMLPQENLGAMRLLLRPFLGQYDASQRPNDRVSHECHSSHCVVHQWCRISGPVWLSAKSHTHHWQCFIRTFRGEKMPILLNEDHILIVFLMLF